MALAVLLLTSLLTTAITDQDWISVDGVQFLALRRDLNDPGDGVAWYARQLSKRRVVAFAGTFRIKHPQGDPQLYLTFMTRWELEFTPDGYTWWKYDPAYSSSLANQYGAMVEFEASPAGYDLSVIRKTGFGNPPAKSPADPLPAPQHLEIGDVIRFRSGMLPALKELAPPGFVSREHWEHRAEEDPDTVHHKDILKKDLYGWIFGGKIPSHLVVSLKSGKEWDGGKAQLVVTQFHPGNMREYFVARGNFQIARAVALDSMSLKLSMTRYYQGKARKPTIDWTAYDHTREGTGVEFSLPLDDHGFRQELLTAYVSNVHFVNEEGGGYDHYTPPKSWFTPGERIVPTSAFGFAIGETAIFQSGSFFGATPALLEDEEGVIAYLESDPPPGLRLRERATRYTVAKMPAIVSTPPSTPTAPLLSLSQVYSQATKLQRDGEYAAARELYSQILSRGGRKAIIYQLRGECSYALKHLAKAEHYFDAANTLHETARTQNMLGEVHATRREYQKALGSFERAIVLDPKNPRPFNGAAWIYATCPEDKLRSGKKAFLYAGQACALTEWKNSHFKATLAAACAELGNFEKAVFYQEAANKDFKGDALFGGKLRLQTYEQRRPHREQ